MAKKLSVAEMLAAARAEKQKGESAPPSPETPGSLPAAAEPEATPPQATSESVAASAEAPVTPTPPTKPASAMSVAEIMAAARAAKAGGAKPASESPAATPAAPTAPAKPAAAMSVAEIMAAARAAKTGGAAAPAPPPAAPTKPAPAAPAAKAETAAPVSTGPKDTASILAAARKTSKPGPITKAEAAAKSAPAAPAAKKKIEVPPMPAKPEYARTPVASGEPQDRRSFMAAGAALLFGSPLAIGFATLAVTHLMWLLGLARFMFPNVLIEPPTRFKVGFPDTLAPGQVESKFIPQFGVWIVKYEFEGAPMIYALKAVCTHLGCTPNWLEAEQKFKCPCHGSGFYKDGINFEGPAPRPLERYAISIADDGQLLVDKSRTFNQELGGWNDPASFVSV